MAPWRIVRTQAEQRAARKRKRQAKTAVAESMADENGQKRVETRPNTAVSSAVPTHTKSIKVTAASGEIGADNDAGASTST
uniref:Uncharacterized protein n=1 Tax=Anopheles funestus TaxID=62324 RepID=A0A182S4H9_ANOFN